MSAADSQQPWCVTTPVRRPTDSDVLRSVATALDVLDCFAVDGDLGVSEVAARLDIAKSTAHRLLVTLVSRGLVERTSEGRYALGLHLHELGHLVQARHELRHRAIGPMRSLSRQTGMSVLLCVPDGPDVVAVDRVETSELAGVLSHLGARLPAHTASAGKVIAAYDSSVAQARRAVGFAPRQVGGIRTDVEWEQQLAEVRRRGYASGTGEQLPDVTSMAVPLFDPQRRVVASLTVLTPADNGEGVERALPAALAAARRIGQVDRPSRYIA